MKLSRKSKSELAVAFCFMIPAIIALHEIQTTFVEKGMHTGGGEQNAALFPRILSVLLLILASVKIIGVIIDSSRADDKKKDEPFFLFEPEGRKRTAAVLAVFVLYIFGLAHLGFYAATPLALTAFFLILGLRKILVLIPISLGTTIAIWYLFGELLKVVLPVGRFGLYF